MIKLEYNINPLKELFLIASRIKCPSVGCGACPLNIYKGDPYELSCLLNRIYDVYKRECSDE